MPNRDGFLTLTEIVFCCRMANDAAAMTSMNPAHVYEVRPRKDDCGVNLISDVLPLRCAVLSGAPDAINNAIDYAKFFSRSHDAVIRVYDEAGNVVETHEHAGDFKEP
jgi:hypothetical protein